MAPIRIAIADDHPMIIGGLQNMLMSNPEMMLTGAYSTGAALLKGLAQTQPDILLLDIQMPDKTGDTLTPVILSRYPDIRIIALTNMSSPFYAHNMFRLGVSGYVLKNSDPEILIEAIREIALYRSYVDPSMRAELEVFKARMKRESAIRPTLTDREKEILAMTAAGLSIKEISEQLYIGIRTVERYRSNLFIKLDVKNMAGLIRKTIELGLD